MELNLRASKIMDVKNSKTTGNEHRLIRIPSGFRESMGLSVNNFINLKDTHNGIVTLQIAESYPNDTLKDKLCGYTTSDNYNNISATQYDATYTYREGIKIRRVEGITLGCDPEAFLLYKNSDNVVAAYRFFGKYGDVGHDGILIEFRPMYSNSAETVTNNIYNLLLKARYILDKSEEGRNIEIIGASALKGLTAGFHLHYGLPKILLGQNSGLKKIIANLITKALDYYVGVPSIIPEGNNDVLRRTIPYTDYGKPGGYRLSFKTFEYRLPGGICMIHPILTTGLLSIGAVVIEDLISRINICTDNFNDFRNIVTDKDLRDIYPNLPDIRTIYGLICSESIKPAKSHLSKIMNDIRQMIGYNYENRAVAIENFFYYITLETNFFSNNIEKNWRLIYEK